MFTNVTIGTNIEDLAINNCFALEFPLNYKRLEIYSIFMADIKYSLITDVKLEKCSEKVFQSCPKNATFCESKEVCVLSEFW